MNKGTYGLPKSKASYIPPCKVYTALINQSSTDPPTAIVLENTIGQVRWSYNGVGKYQINSDRLFTVNKTYIHCESIFNVQWSKNIFPTLEESNQPNYLTITNYDYTIPDVADGVDKALIEIRVYF